MDVGQTNYAFGVFLPAGNREQNLPSPFAVTRILAAPKRHHHPIEFADFRCETIHEDAAYSF
jgi:hypothetical protein